MDDTTLTRRICRILARLPGWDGPELAKHADADVAIFYGAIGDKPDRAVGVRVYADVVRGDDARAARRIQLRFRGARGAPDDADQMASIAHAVLDGTARTDGVNAARRDSFTQLAADQNRREQRSDNYLIIIDNLEALT